MLETWVYNLQQMLNLVMNLLDISRAENNSLNLDITEFSLYKLINTTIKEVSLLANQKEIIVQNKVAEYYFIKGDQDLLLRVFTNLMSNAIKFSKQSDVIYIKTKITEEKNLRISVIDTGAGINKKSHEVIFEQFKQLDNAKASEVRSSGLGLAFCRMAVNAHNWEIGVNSEPGKGAEFWIDMKDFVEKN